MNLFSRIIKQNVEHLLLISKLFILLMLMLICNTANASNEPEGVVKNVTSQVYEVLKTYDIKSSESNSSNALIEEKISSSFDFNHMFISVLGNNFGNLSQSQKNNFEFQFRRFFIRSYSLQLAYFVNQNIDYLPSELSQTGNQITVRTKIIQPNQTNSMNYNLKRTSEGWKIYDFFINDVSIITNYRSQFSNDIKQSGIDALNNKLAEKNGTVGEKITTVSQSFTVTPSKIPATSATTTSQSNSYSAPSGPDPLFDIISGVTGIVVQNKVNHDAKRQRQAVAQQQAYQQAQTEQQAYENSRAQLNAQRAQQTQANTEINVGSTSTTTSNNNSNSGNSKQEATQCLRQAQTNNGQNGLQNICSKRVGFSYCDIGETGHSLLLCGKEIGGKFLEPGEINAWNSSSQRQYYIGCFFPYWPQNTKWNGQNLHADFCG